MGCFNRFGFCRVKNSCKQNLPSFGYYVIKTLQFSTVMNLLIVLKTVWGVTPTLSVASWGRNQGKTGCPEQPSAVFDRQWTTGWCRIKECVHQSQGTAAFNLTNRRCVVHQIMFIFRGARSMLHIRLHWLNEYTLQRKYSILKLVFPAWKM